MPSKRASRDHSTWVLLPSKTQAIVFSTHEYIVIKKCLKIKNGERVPRVAQVRVNPTVILVSFFLFFTPPRGFFLWRDFHPHPVLPTMSLKRLPENNFY